MIRRAWPERGAVSSTLTFAVVVICVGVLLTAGSGSKSVYAHTFSGDESASFLASVEVVRAQTALAQADFANNKTLASYHAEHAVEALSNDTIEEISEKNQRLGTDLPAALGDFQEAVESGQSADSIQTIAAEIDSLLSEAIGVRIEKSQLTNATVQALVVVNLLDDTVEHYNAAFGIEEEEGTGNTSPEPAANNSSTIVSVGDYHSAQAFANRTQQMYTELKPKALANATESIKTLDTAFSDLVQAVNNKESPDAVAEIVENRIDSNLRVAYNIIPEFPVPVILIISAMVGVVIAGRVAMIRKSL